MAKAQLHERELKMDPRSSVWSDQSDSRIFDLTSILTNHNAVRQLDLGSTFQLSFMQLAVIVLQ